MLSEMSSVLNVDTAYIDDAAEDLIAQDDTLRMLNENTEIIGDLFLDNLAMEINEYLEEVGSISVGELATKHGFAVDFVQHLLKTRLESKKLIGTLRRDKLYSEEFRKRLEKRLIGALSGSTRPTSLQSLLQRFDFLDRSVVVETAKRLCSNGSIDGTIVSDEEYIPTIYKTIQINQCNAFFDSNGWMSKSRALKWKVTNLYEMLTTKWSNCIELSTCVIQYEKMEILIGNIDEMVLNKSFLYIPNSINNISLDNSKDVSMLMRLAIDSIEGKTGASKKMLADDLDDVKKKKSMVLINGLYVVTLSFINKCRSIFIELSKKYSEKIAKDNEKVPTGMQRGTSNEGEEYVIVSPSSPKKSFGKGSGKSGGKSGKRNKKGKRNEDEEDDEEEEDNGKGKKGKGKKGRGGKGKRKKGRKGQISSDEEEEMDQVSQISDKQQAKRDKRREKKNKKKGNANGNNNSNNGSSSNNGVDPQKETEKHVTVKMMKSILRSSFPELNIDPDGDQDGEQDGEQHGEQDGEQDGEDQEETFNTLTTSNTSNDILLHEIVKYIINDVRDLYVQEITLQFASKNRSQAEDMHKLVMEVQKTLIQKHSQFVMDVKTCSKLKHMIDGLNKSTRQNILKNEWTKVNNKEDEEDEEEEEEEDDSDDENGNKSNKMALENLLSAVCSSCMSTVGMDVLSLYAISRLNQNDVQLVLSKYKEKKEKKEKEEKEENIDETIPTPTTPSPTMCMMNVLRTDLSLLRTLMNRFEKSVTTPLSHGLSVIKSINSTPFDLSIQSITNSIDELAHECNLILKPHDKKTERNLIYKSTLDIAAMLEKMEHINIECMSYVCTLLLSKMENVYLVLDKKNKKATQTQTHHVTMVLLLSTLVSPSVADLLRRAIVCLENEEAPEEETVLKGLKSLCAMKKSVLKTVVIDQEN